MLTGTVRTATLPLWVVMVGRVIMEHMIKLETFLSGLNQPITLLVLHEQYEVAILIPEYLEQ
jgi:hypothetical protein